MYIVVLEWDGEKPPMAFYNRLHTLGLFVRGDKMDAEGNEITPLKRRAISDGSVIAQEGAIICASQSLANIVAAEAVNWHAKDVQIASLEPVAYTMSAEDAKIMNRIEAIFGRKGRPSGEKVDWVVTCLEETKSYPLDEERDAINCPYCSGLRIRARIGKMDHYKFPDKGSVFKAWRRHRFVHGEFETPVEDAEDEPPMSTSIQNEDEKKVVRMMGNSPDFLRQIRKLPRHMAKRVLDGVLSARTHMPKEVRKTKRVEAVVYLFERNVAPTKVSLLEAIDKVDILDAASIIGSDMAGQLWLAVNH